ncbi:dopamine D2-like receptor [Brachionus plicatilis]|uniref:Dopamine D2-like receptor n=1 Tax=Brachionus plicatilis TaxID=10195 RepID=A0A3M7SF47_BRAPC|nr:dopamine D2-like receptor [Brachionus plicatilis]
MVLDMLRYTKKVLVLDAFDYFLTAIVIFYVSLGKIQCNINLSANMELSPKADEYSLVFKQFNQTDAKNSYAIYGFNYIGFNNSETANPSESDQSLHYWALILLFCPISTIFGNILVVVSVIKEKSLRTVTNYFVVSLALADLTVAAAVMPFAVYYEVTRKWHLTNIVCDAWVALDVMASTASILNLVAIAIDRFIAVTQPIKYARHKSSNRIYLMIGLVWLISVAIASPIAVGLNNTPERASNECSFNNHQFLIYSSMFSFYIPTFVMVVLYFKIFKVIRSRAKKAQAAKIVNRKPANKQDTRPNSDNQADHSNPLNECENKQKINLISPRIFNLKNKTVEVVVRKGADKKKSSSIFSIAQARRSSDKTQKRHHSIGLLSINVLRSQIHPSAASNHKERKITKTLLIVLIVFLVCWSPFFALNNLTRGICIEFAIECSFISDELISFLTWLGYLNSMLNPVIYTIFNIEFRKAFVKILSECCTKKRF